MGHQATVIFNLDHTHILRDDPDLGAKLSDAIGKLSLPKEYRGGGDGSPIHSGGATVAYAIESHHCDYDALLLAGNLGARVVSSALFVTNEGGTEEENVLRALADQLGFYVARKPRRKKSGS